MSIEKLTPNKIENKKIEIKNTNDFHSLINNSLESETESEKKELLCQAEKWLNKLKKNQTKYPQYFNNPDRPEGWWADQQEYRLFKTFRNIQNFEGANRIIESMEDTPHAKKVGSKQGRINILSKELEETN